MWRDRGTTGKQLSCVLEYDDAITEQAPALLGVTDDGACRLAVRPTGIRTPWRVRAHSCSSCGSELCLRSHTTVPAEHPITAWPVVTVFRAALCRFHVFALRMHVASE